MKTVNAMFNQTIKLGLLLMLSISMSACAGFLGFGGTSWKEEVLLHDGQKIIVERAVKRGGRHELGQRPPISEQSLSFIMPSNNQRVIWKDEFSEDIGSGNFNPMLLDIVNDIAYVLVSPAGCLSYNKWGRPNPPYVVFKYQNKEWKRIPLQELPAEIKLPNLVISSPDNVAKDAGYGLLSAERIRRENTGFSQPAYKTILRVPTPGDGGPATGCGEMILKGKGGWDGIGWFRDQPSKEACLKYCENEEVSAQNCPCNRLFKGK